MGCRQIPAQISAPSSVREDSRRVKGGHGRRETAPTSGFPLVRPYNPPCYKRARAPASGPPRPAVHPLSPLQGNMCARKRPLVRPYSPSLHCRRACAPASVPPRPAVHPLSPLQGNTRAHKRFCLPSESVPDRQTARQHGPDSALPAATVQTTVAPSRTGTKRGPLSAVTAPPAGPKTAPPPSPASPTGPGPQAGAHSL